MLETLDLTRRLKKQEYKELIPKLEIQLGRLQRRARQLGIPTLIVFEGWDAAGKGTLTNKLILTFDPRGYDVHSMAAPTPADKARPFLWRFWVRTPGEGRIGVFVGSWYRRVLEERVAKLVKKRVWSRAYGEINAFERNLNEGGIVLLKFFLHISKKEQAKRFRALEKKPTLAARVSGQEWKRHKRYDKYLDAVEEMLARTDSAYAPWAVVEAHDERFATVKVFRTVISALERRVKAAEAKAAASAAAPAPTQEETAVLDRVDLTRTLSRAQYDKALRRHQRRIRELQYQAYLEQLPLIIVYEGWDASGKGGNIRRLCQAMDPRGYRVVPISAPNDLERSQHYLWRFWREIPPAGKVVIFDRSWYGRVLVERVENFAQEAEWRRAYREINAMEEQFVNYGAVLIKFWLHIDAEEQLRRFKQRQRIAHKRWKISDDDWRNRESWDTYRVAVDEMLRRTSTAYAPWTIIPANSKLYARIEALKTVERRLAERL